VHTHAHTHARMLRHGELTSLGSLRSSARSAQYCQTHCSTHQPPPNTALRHACTRARTQACAMAARAASGWGSPLPCCLPARKSGSAAHPLQPKLQPSPVLALFQAVLSAPPTPNRLQSMATQGIQACLTHALS